MQRIRAARAISLIVMIAGLVEMTAWILGMHALKSISGSFVTMKFSSAVCFFLSGISFYFISETVRGRYALAQVVLPGAALIIMLFMATQLASAIFGVQTGIENMFVRESTGAVMTTVPGRPSVVTMLDFIVIASVSVISMFRLAEIRRVLKAFGFFIGATGCIAAAGYIFSVPLLYFSVPGYSTAMAVNTAALFMLLGAGFILLAGAET